MRRRVKIPAHKQFAVRHSRLLWLVSQKLSVGILLLFYRSAAVVVVKSNLVLDYFHLDVEVTREVALTWDQYKDDIQYLSTTGSVLHVVEGGYEIEVGYTFGGNRLFDRIKIEVSPIDVSDRADGLNFGDYRLQRLELTCRSNHLYRPKLIRFDILSRESRVAHWCLSMKREWRTK